MITLGWIRLDLYLYLYRFDYIRLDRYGYGLKPCNPAEHHSWKLDAHPGKICCFQKIRALCFDLFFAPSQYVNDHGCPGPSSSACLKSRRLIIPLALRRSWTTSWLASWLTYVYTYIYIYTSYSIYMSFTWFALISYIYNILQ